MRRRSASPHFSSPMTEFTKEAPAIEEAPEIAGACGPGPPGGRRRATQGGRKPGTGGRERGPGVGSGGAGHAARARKFPRRSDARGPARAVVGARPRPPGARVTSRTQSSLASSAAVCARSRRSGRSRARRLQLRAEQAVRAPAREREGRRAGCGDAAPVVQKHEGSKVEPCAPRRGRPEDWGARLFPDRTSSSNAPSAPQERVPLQGGREAAEGDEDRHDHRWRRLQGPRRSSCNPRLSPRS